MKPLIITSMLATMWLFLAINPLLAWQDNTVSEIPGEASGKAADETEQVQTEPGTLNRGGNLGPLTQAGSAATGNTRQISYLGIMITWSEDNDELRGFSNSLGEWETLKIDKQEKIVPLVAEDVAAVRVGDSIAAFSGVKGWWDMIPLSKGSIAQPVVNKDLVSIEDNGHLYTFAAAKGRWTSPTDPDLRPIREEIKADPKAVPLAEWPFEQWLETLPRYKARGIRGQFSGSGTIYLYLERKSLLEEASAAIGEALKRHETIAAVKTPPAPVTDAATAENRIAELRAELQKLELAFNASSDTELRERIEEAFDLRQQLQRVEAQRMRLKLQEIEASLDVREKSRDTIIDQHFRKLVHRPDEPATIQEPKGSGNDAVTSMPRGHVAPSVPQVPRNSVAETAIGIPEDTIQSPDPKFTKEYPLDRVSGARSGAGQWNETLLIRKSLADKLAITKDVEQKLNDIRSRLTNYNKPLSEWNEEDKKEYSEAVQTLRTRFSAKGSTTKYDLDLQRVRDLNHDRYVREGILSKVFGGGDPGAVSEMSATTDEMLDGIRLDLVLALESRQTTYHSTFERALAEWKETWNAYQSRLRLLKLDVEEAKLAFESRTARDQQVRKQHEAGLLSNSEVQKSASVLSAARFALLRAEELLRLYADIEAQEPDLNPDSFKAEK